MNGEGGHEARLHNSAPDILALLQDVRSRLARILEALYDGELDLAQWIAEDLESDVGRALEAK